MFTENNRVQMFFQRVHDTSDTYNGNSTITYQEVWQTRETLDLGAFKLAGARCSLLRPSVACDATRATNSEPGGQANATNSVRFYIRQAKSAATTTTLCTARPSSVRTDLLRLRIPNPGPLLHYCHTRTSHIIPTTSR